MLFLHFRNQPDLSWLQVLMKTTERGCKQCDIASYMFSYNKYQRQQRSSPNELQIMLKMHTDKDIYQCRKKHRKSKKLNRSVKTSTAVTRPISFTMHNIRVLLNLFELPPVKLYNEPLS